MIVSTVSAVADPLVLSFTVLYDDVEDGWVMARVLEKPGAISQGRTRAEARENVRDALRELLLHEGTQLPDDEIGGDREALQLTIAP